MKTIRFKLVIGISLAFGAAAEMHAQYVTAGIHSIDTPFDPRSIAAGESFVAVRGNRYASMYNPAGLSGIEGYGVSFSRRNFNHLSLTSTWKYIAFTGTVSTPLADFSIVYNRFHQAEFEVTTEQNPDGTGDRVRVSDYLLGLGAGMEIIDGIDVGLQVKTFRPVAEVTAGSYQGGKFNNPLLLDAGVIGSLDGEFANTSVGYSLAGGIAFQNFGTDLIAETTNLLGGTSKYVSPLPRLWRTGLSFGISTPRLVELGLSPVSIMVTTEYRVVLNSLYDPNEHFWGFGSELTVLEIFTGRIGAFIPSVTSIYGVRNEPWLRFCLGLRVPLGLMGIDPFSLRLDYSSIPLNTRIPFFPLENTTLHAFSLELVYERDLFGSLE